MALNKNHFPFSHGCLFLLGFQGSPQVRFATMERQHNALSDELWGDELSLAKVRASFVFFLGGGELPTKIHQETTRDKQKLSNNNRFFESWVDESMEISDGKCPGCKKLWQFKSAGLFNACVFLLNKR